MAGANERSSAARSTLASISRWLGRPLKLDQASAKTRPFAAKALGDPQRIRVEQVGLRRHDPVLKGSPFAAWMNAIAPPSAVRTSYSTCPVFSISITRQAKRKPSSADLHERGGRASQSSSLLPDSSPVHRERSCSESCLQRVMWRSSSLHRSLRSIAEHSARC